MISGCSGGASQKSSRINTDLRLPGGHQSRETLLSQCENLIVDKRICADRADSREVQVDAAEFQEHSRQLELEVLSCHSSLNCALVSPTRALRGRSTLSKVVVMQTYLSFSVACRY